MRAFSRRAKSGIAPTSARSNGSKISSPAPAAAMFLMTDLSSAPSERASATTRKPSRASLRAMARPIPRLPPVTRTLRTGALQLAAGGHGQRRHEPDAGRRLVRRKLAAAGGEDLGLERILVPGRVG